MPLQFRSSERASELQKTTWKLTTVSRLGNPDLQNELAALNLLIKECTSIFRLKKIIKLQGLLQNIKNLFEKIRYKSTEF